MATASAFRRGLHAGIPIGLGYFSVSLSFGILAVSYGFSWWQAVLISMTTVTSAGQFAGINTMLHPGQYLAMLISQLTINVRYSMMSVSLSQKVDKSFGKAARWNLYVYDVLNADLQSLRELDTAYEEALVKEDTDYDFEPVFVVFRCTEQRAQTLIRLERMEALHLTLQRTGG